MQSLKPIGLPPDNLRNSAMKCSISTGVEKAEWQAGDIQSTTKRNAARRGDFGRHLSRRQNTAMTGLGTLRQLDLDHLDLRSRRLCRKTLRRKRAVGIAAAEIAASDLPDDVATEFAMMDAATSLARIVRKAAELGALVQSPDRIGAERAETHRRNIEKRRRIGLPALRSADRHPEILRRDIDRCDRMGEPFEIFGVDVKLRAKRPLVELPLGALIDDRPLRPVVGDTVGVALEKILPNFGTDYLEHEADVGEDRISPPQAVFCLHHIPDADHTEQ